MNIRSSSAQQELKNGNAVTSEDGTVCKSADVYEPDPDEPEKTILVVDIPSVEYLDGLNNNQALIKLQKNTNSKGAMNVVLHYSPDHVMNHIKYKAFLDKFSETTTHMVLNESNK